MADVAVLARAVSGRLSRMGMEGRAAIWRAEQDAASARPCLLRWQAEDGPEGGDAPSEVGAFQRGDAACCVSTGQFLARRCRHRGVNSTETSDDKHGSCRIFLSH